MEATEETTKSTANCDTAGESTEPELHENTQETDFSTASGSEVTKKNLKSGCILWSLKFLVRPSVCIVLD